MYNNFLKNKKLMKKLYFTGIVSMQEGWLSHSWPRIRRHGGRCWFLGEELQSRAKSGCRS